MSSYQKEPENISPFCTSLTREINLNMNFEKRLDETEGTKPFTEKMPIKIPIEPIKETSIIGEIIGEIASSRENRGSINHNSIENMVCNNTLHFTDNLQATLPPSMNLPINDCSQSAFNNTTSKKDKSEKEKRTNTLLALISNIYLTKKFIKTLKTITSLRTPDFVAKKNFNIINDLCFYYDIWIKRGNSTPNHDYSRLKTLLFEKSIKQLKNLIKKISVFENSSIFLMIWNIIHIFFILFFFFIIPLEKTFDVKLEANYEQVYYIEKGAFYFFLLDIAVILNTSVYIKGKLIHKRKIILKNYLQTSFYRDIISTFSIFARIYMNFDSTLYSYLELMFFLRMLTFSKIIAHLEEMFFIDQSMHNILSLLKLIFRIILLSHIFSSLWCYMGFLSLSDSWINHQGLLGKEWYILYLNAYYFVCITMNTVGYGDITAQNSYEKVFSIIFIYMACGLFAYSLNSIGMIVSNIAKRNDEFQKNKTLINGYMKQKKINSDLRMRINKYLEYIYYEEKVEQIEEEAEIIGKLSDSLKQELLLEANSSIIKNLKMFTRNFSEYLLSDVIPIIKEVRFTPGDIIFSNGETEDKSLFIVRKGQVEIFQEVCKSNGTVTVLNTLKIGQTFGELSFFSDQARTCSARSIDFTTAYIIKREEFLKLLKKHPLDYETFCQMSDNINNYERNNELFLKCTGCQNPNHTIQQCPNLFYIPKREIVISKYVYSTDQNRNESFKRKICKLKYKSLAQNKEIKENVIFFQDEIMSPTTLSFEKYEANSFEPESSELLRKPLDEGQFGKKSTYDGMDDENMEEEGKKMEKEKQEKPEKIMPKTTKSFEKDESPSNNVDSIKNQSISDFKRLNERKITKKTSYLAEVPAIKVDMDYNFQKVVSNSKTNLMENNKMMKSIVVTGGKRKEKYSSKEDVATRDYTAKTKTDKGISSNAVNNYSIQNIPEFDLVKSWESYFPQNNCSNVVEKINQKNQRIKMKYKEGRLNNSKKTKSGAISFVNTKNQINSYEIKEIKSSGKSVGVSMPTSPKKHAIRKSFFQNKKSGLNESGVFDTNKFRLKYVENDKLKNVKEIYKKIIGKFFFQK